MLNSKLISFRIPLLTLLFALPTHVWAQNGDLKTSAKLQNQLLNTKAQETITLFVYFKDKGDNIEEKLLASKIALSAKSLQRRIINRGADNVVSFTDIPINPVYLELLKAEVTKIRHQLSAINAISVEATPEAITKIANFEFVEKIELVNKLLRKPTPLVAKVEPSQSLKDLIKLKNSELALDYGISLAQNAQINVPAVHEMGYSGSSIVIAVFDTGFNRLSHESFAQTVIAGTWDFVNNDVDVSDNDDIGEGSHGTNTLSTIGGYSPGNLIGPAYGAIYYLAKTENTESELHVEEDNWCAAIEWADANGAQIVSSSLGYAVFDSGGDYSADDMDGNTTIITQCADLAAENGIVIINSAGNEGAGSGKNTLGAPSDGNFVVAVGAVTASGVRSSFSSVGPSADGRIKPDVMAMGSNVYVASSFSDSTYANYDGTSFSCPLTAGVAALILESNPALTAVQVRDILRNSADRANTPDNLYGYGIINSLTAVEAAIQASAGSIAPNASFAVTTNSLTASFTNTSTDSDGTIVSYLWDFNDGSSVSVENPNHTYAIGGVYSVSLTVTDNDGLTETISQNISITSSASSGGGINNQTSSSSSSSSGGGSIGFMLFACLSFLSRKRNKLLKG